MQLIVLTVVLILASVVLLILIKTTNTSRIRESDERAKKYGESKPYKLLPLYLSLIPLALIVISYVVGSVTSVGTGNVGVLTLFGSVDPVPISEGVSFINPFKEVHEMSVKTQNYDGTTTTLSSDQLLLEVDLTLPYRLDPSSAPWIYQNFGEKYVDLIIVPAGRSAMRDGVAQYNSQDASVTKRDQLSKTIYTLMEQNVNNFFKKYTRPSGLNLGDLLIRDIKLPDVVQTAINMKIKAQQEAEQMQFTLQKERQEAERKEIEASGIKKFQQIVTEGISDKLLEWKGIEATEKLANSPNTKIVIAGNKQGLPLIFNAGN